MERSERLNQELIFLSYKHHFHVSDLMQEFNISKRTALRDISSLEQLGLAFYVEAGRYGGYHLTKRQLWAPVLLSLPEINALFFAIKALSLLSATPFEKSYTTIYQKLMAALPLSEQKKVARLQEVVNYYTIPNLDGPAFLPELLAQILNGSATLLRFEKHPAEQPFQLFDLLYRNGVWFVSGTNLTTHEWTIVRCETVTSVQTAPTPAPYTRDQLAAQQTIYEHHSQATPYQCRLTPRGKALVQRNHYPNMHLKQVGGQDYLYGGYNPDEYDYMVQYLLGLGTNVQIMYPQSLQDGYLNAIDEIRNMYK